MPERQQPSVASPDADPSDPAVHSTASDDGVTADTKYGKAEVNYRDAGSSNTRCERCKNFAWSTGSSGKGTCRIVAGLISPGGVCDKFASGGAGLIDLVTGEAQR